jgi:hypothetical protein
MAQETRPISSSAPCHEAKKVSKRLHNISAFSQKNSGKFYIKIC